MVEFLKKFSGHYISRTTHIHVTAKRY
jgi:hypothetical protein